MSSIIFVRNGVIKVFLSSSYQAETNSRPSKNTLDQSTLRRCRSLLRRSRSVQLRLCGAPHNRRVTNGFRSEWGAKSTPTSAPLSRPAASPAAAHLPPSATLWRLPHPSAPRRDQVDRGGELHIIGITADLQYR